MNERTTDKIETRALCGNCGGDRNCHIHGRKVEKLSNPVISWRKEWLLLQCKGCDNIFVKTSESDSESYYVNYDDETGELQEVPIETIKHWPAISARKTPDWFKGDRLHGRKDTKPLSASLIELYGALNADLNMLAGIGIRTTFDVASELLGVDPGLRFNKKLEDLVLKGHIGKADQTTISTLIDAGSASAHRGWKPTNQDLETLMDVLEHFIETAFVAPAKKAQREQKMKEVKNNVPVKKTATTKDKKKKKK